MKQSHLAELLGVSQATVSRWERGELRPTEAQRAALRRALQAMPWRPAHDLALKRLVEGSAERLHLVCDRTHRLLAASGPRWAQWRLAPAEMEDAPMLAFASPEILKAEASLEGLGWRDGALAELVVETGPNGRADIPIAPGRFAWRQVLLSDGAVGRLTVSL